MLGDIIEKINQCLDTVKTVKNRFIRLIKKENPLKHAFNVVLV